MKSEMETTLRSRKTGQLALLAVAFVFYAVRMFRLISQYAVNVFFSDQWDIDDATLFRKHSLWEMFSWQHGPHRQGLGALFQKLVDPVFAWDSRIESFVVGGVIVVAAVCALCLKKRLCGSFSFFDIAIPALLFTPAQWETLFVTANFAHGPLPLLLLLLYCLSWTTRNRGLRYSLILIINFVTIYTGFGLFVGVLTPILLALDYWSSTPPNRLPKTYFAIALVVALLSLGSFFLGYKFNSAIGCFAVQPLRPKAYAAFVDLMFASLFTVKGTHGIYLILGGISLAAVLVTMAVAAWRLLGRSTREMTECESTRQLVILAVTAYSLLFCLNTAYGRLCGGLLLALAPRYVIYVEPAILGVYFQVLSMRKLSAQKWLLGGLLIAFVVASFRTDRAEMENIRAIKQTWRTCYLQTEDIQQCDQEAKFPIHGPTPVEQGHLQEKLQYLKQTHTNLYAGH